MRRTVACAVTAIAAAGCSPHKVTLEPEPPVTVPAQYGEPHGGNAPERWWLQFEDDALNALVRRTFADNLRLHAAWARLQQARAVARRVSGAEWPQLSADLKTSRSRQRNFLADIESGAPAGAAEETFTRNQFSASVAASYELDLWRELDSRTKAAALDARAARGEVDSIAISLAAQVTEAYYDLLLERARRAVLEDQVEVNETFLDLVTLRFKQGLASALDVHQQRQQLLATRAQVPLAQARAEVRAHQLAVLIGEPPQVDVARERGELPDLPPMGGTGVPADLLVRRPDVRAARRQLEAADYRVAAAVADRLPSITLTGSIGLQDSSLVDLLGSPIWTLASSLGQVLFAGGRLEAEVERNEAVVRERAADFGQTLLEAMLEVENALAQQRHQLQYIDDKERELEVARSALREARARYRQGLSDFLPVLTALQAVQRVELELLLAERQALSYRIQLCRALGGTWPAELAPPRGGKKS